MLSAKKILLKLHLLDFAKRVRFIAMSFQTSWLKFIYPNGKYIVGPNQCSIYVDFKNQNFRWYYNKNLFLEQEHKAFSILLNLKKPSVIIDVGAHWGIFPAMLEADYNRFPSIKHVICIEPDPKNIPILKRTISKIRNFKVTIVESAVGETDSEIFAHRDGGACLQTYNNHSLKSSVKVAMRRLETIISSTEINPDQVTHIKIDIDGYEPSFFIGNQEWLKTVSPLILSEYWAKGLERHPKYSISEYNKFLFEMFYVIKCNYPKGTYSILDFGDIENLNNQTKISVANLLLIPKTAFNLDELRGIFKC